MTWKQSQARTRHLLSLTACVCLLTSSSPLLAEVAYVERPPSEGRNPHYPGNRPPLVPNPLTKLPIGAIRLKGWLRKMLELQRDGFHGRLGEISRFLRKENNAWLSPTGEGEHGWEEPPYWLKGYLNLAYVLGDEDMIREARLWVDAAIRSQKEDGWFGPDRGRRGAATRLQGREDLWPNMIMLFCLQNHYEATGDERVLKLMDRYFRYLMKVPEDRFLVGYWPRMRGGDLLLSVLWYYNQSGEEWLLDLARKVHRRTADWTSGLINWHNVNISQGFREPATFYMLSGDKKHLEASYRNYAQIRELYGQMPGGMFASDENCRPGYTDPRQAVETCGMVEMMFSTETLTWITGDPIWADRAEDVAFNSFPASMTPDLKALRYLTSPNLVLSDARSKSPGVQNGGPMFLMNPHIHRCCQHNSGHGWPYFAEHLWFATRDRGLAAVFYCESEVTAKVAEGVEVTIEEATKYPFRGDVTFRVKAPRPVRFPLYLRVPAWCDAPELKVCGDTVAVKGVRPRGYLRVEREWRSGDTVELVLPMKIRIRRWEKNHSSVSVDRGPLTFSLLIREKYVRAGGTDEWPAWEIHPASPWNYGLILDPEHPERSFEVIERPWPANDMPFTHEGTPVLLKARGKRIPEWQLDHLGLVGKLQPSPVYSEEPEEEITLIPMGAARLRISAFPVIGEGPNAHRWKGPPKPAYRTAASHCFANDTPLAAADGLVPKSSNDHSIPRFTWWDHRGTREWFEARFEKPRKVSAVEIYWFDDTGRGYCRVPESWRLLYLDGDKWKEVENPSGYGVELDRFNRTTFKPVVTEALRLEVQLKEGFSGGILELRFE